MGHDAWDKYWCKYFNWTSRGEESCVAANLTMLEHHPQYFLNAYHNTGWVPHLVLEGFLHLSKGSLSTFLVMRAQNKLRKIRNWRLQLAQKRWGEIMGDKSLYQTGGTPIFIAILTKILQNSFINQCIQSKIVAFDCFYLFKKIENTIDVNKAR